ncbi:MAG: type II secretion system protein GspG [Armatimonadota bacterium]
MEDQQQNTESTPQAVLPVPPPPEIKPTPKPPFWNRPVGKWVDAVFFVFVLVALGFIIIISSTQYHSLSPKAKDATHRANLHQLRNAIAMFEADTGEYPASLKDLIALEEGMLKARVPKGSYQGPYLTGSSGIDGTGIPYNPFIKYPGKTDREEVDDPVIEHHWSYSPKDGKVHSAVKGETIDGVAYEDL